EGLAGKRTASARRGWWDRLKSYIRLTTVGSVSLGAVLILPLLGLVQQITPERGWSDFQKAAEQLIASRAPEDASVAEGVIARLSREQPVAAEAAYDTAVERTNAEIERHRQTALARVATMRASTALLDRARAKITELADSARDQIMPALQESAEQA